MVWDGCWQDLQAFLTAGRTCSPSSILLLLERPFHYSTQPFLPSLTHPALVQSIFPLRSFCEHQWWLSLWLLAAVPWTPSVLLSQGLALRWICGSSKAGPRWRGEDKARRRNKSQKTRVRTSGSNLPPKLLIPSMLEHCLCITFRAIFVRETERERERENIFPLRSFLLTFSSKKINVLSSPFHSLALHPADSPF